ncbi:hypothetical protein FOXYSP1_19452 [Fusarium oxysporum f. sp. phaseoli]
MEGEARAVKSSSINLFPGQRQSTGCMEPFCLCMALIWLILTNRSNRRALSTAYQPATNTIAQASPSPGLEAMKTMVLSAQNGISLSFFSMVASFVNKAMRHGFLSKTSRVQMQTKQRLFEHTQIAWVTERLDQLEPKRVAVMKEKEGFDAAVGDYVSVREAQLASWLGQV